MMKMFGIESTALPGNALSRKYADVDGAYLDCYQLEIDSRVTLEKFVIAFYTTAIFKIERLILHHLVSKPSDDIEAAEVAAGTTDQFAAWRVEDRAEHQLLMCDFQGVTRSWFMVAPSITSNATSLYFGSVIVPAKDGRTGKFQLGRLYRALLGFHRVYSRVLLYSAKTRLNRLNKSNSA